MRHSTSLAENVAKQLLVQGYSGPASRILRALGVPDEEIREQMQPQAVTLKGIIASAGPTSFISDKWPHTVLLAGAGKINSPADFDELVEALYVTVDDFSRIEAIAAVIMALPQSTITKCLKWIRAREVIPTGFARSIMISAFLQRSSDLREAGVEPATLLLEARTVLEMYVQDTNRRWRVNPWVQANGAQMLPSAYLVLTPQWAHILALAALVRFSRSASMPDGLHAAEHTFFDLLGRQLDTTQHWDGFMANWLKRVVDTLAVDGLAEQIGAEFLELDKRWAVQP